MAARIAESPEWIAPEPRAAFLSDDAIDILSFAADALLGNFRAVLDELNRAKPATAKGRYVRGLTVASTQGPGVKVDVARLRPEDDGTAS